MFADSKKPAVLLVAFTAAVVASLAAVTSVLARDITQDQVDEKIRACGAIVDAAERMDCFNAVVEGLDEESAGAELPAGDSASAPATSPPPAAAPAAAAGAAAAEPPVDDFGLEDQKIAEAKEKEKEAQNQLESIRATIVTSNKSGLNHFVVVLDNDQVWEETDGSRRPGLPKVGASVHIYRGKLGGYRMKVGNDNRISWVRRLR